jgi:hypothetical protein
MYAIPRVSPTMSRPPAKSKLTCLLNFHTPPTSIQHRMRCKRLSSIPALRRVFAIEPFASEEAQTEMKRLSPANYLI